MANHLSHILSDWFELKDQAEWVLGTVFDTVGSSYRKAGAMMMFSSLGHRLGLLSGGCLEADIQRHARRVMQSGESMTLVYDGNDEDDISFQLGIGCGGVVRILLQPVSSANQYLDLDKLHQSLLANKSGTYSVDLTSPTGISGNHFEFSEANRSAVVRTVETGKQFLNIPTKPLHHLLIVGGGVDARPIARMATEIGWRVSIWDPRPANARKEFFDSADFLIRDSIEGLAKHIKKQSIDAAVVMSHSIKLDVQAVKLLSTVRLKYLALLGPTHRRFEVLDEAGVIDDHAAIQCIAGPAGLDLGGELPEAIALSILAECQAVLSGRNAQSLSLSLPINGELINKQSINKASIHNTSIQTEPYSKEPLQKVS